MVSQEIGKRAVNLIKNIKAFGGEEVPGEYDLIEKVTNHERLIIEQGRYVSRLIQLPEDQKKRILDVLEAGWEKVEDKKRKNGKFTEHQVRFYMRFGKVLIGVATLLLPSKDEEVKQNMAFANDVVKRVFRWTLTNTKGIFHQFRPVTKGVAAIAWNGAVEDFWI